MGNDRRKARRNRARTDHVGDLFEIFPDLPRPFHAHTPKWVVLRHLERVRAKAASIIGRHRLESDRRRAYLQRALRSE
jgi:hypothetical protein